MRKLCATYAVFALVFCVNARAEEKAAEVTLKGKLVCGKCTVKVCKDCTNVLQVEKDGKTIDYFLDDKGKAESYHKAICPPGKSSEATVTGVVTEKDGKKWIKPSKVEVK